MNIRYLLLILISSITISAMDSSPPYIPVYVNCRTIFNIGYSEWIYMLNREQSACNRFCEATLNPININESTRVFEEHQAELEELIRYRRTLLQKLFTTIQSVADWYGANDIVLFYNKEYMWVNPNYDITQEVINELNDYHEFVNPLVSEAESKDGK